MLSCSDSGRYSEVCLQMWRPLPLQPLIHQSGKPKGTDHCHSRSGSRVCCTAHAHRVRHDSGACKRHKSRVVPLASRERHSCPPHSCTQRRLPQAYGLSRLTFLHSTSGKRRQAGKHSRPHIGTCATHTLQIKVSINY